MARVKVDSVQGPTRRQLIKGLVRFNEAASGKSKYKPLTLSLRQGQAIVGGLAGYTSMDWLFVDLLWIADKYRGKGFGKSLMVKAETEAKKRGARNSYLSTFSFQAPGFYKKLGYREFGKQKGFPPGHTRFWLQKAL
jgi:GNAT superfamily N-acetyltransferase